MSDDDRIARLERRLDRERRARSDAERIAEDGLRALYEANRSLDSRIAERTRELEHATRRAEAASRARGAFLAHISHEMRTPLNGIAGMLELLTGEIEDPAAQAWLASAQLSADRLDRLFERTLRVVELESVDLAASAHPMDVEALVVAAGDRWRARCARAGQLLAVEVDTPGACRVSATEEAHRALDELLDNAVDHASAGSVTLSSKIVGDHVRLAVDDSGPGLSRVASTADPLDVSLDPGAEESPGSGLGLALVTRIAESLGGTAGTEANEAGGTRAWFDLPLETD